MADLDTSADLDAVGRAVNVLEADADLVRVAVLAPLHDMRGDPEVVTEIIGVFDRAGVLDTVVDTVEVLDGAAEALIEAVLLLVAVLKERVANAEFEPTTVADNETELLEGEAVDVTVAAIDAVTDLRGEPEGLALIVFDRVTGLLEGDAEVLLVRVMTLEPDPLIVTVDVLLTVWLFVPVADAVGLEEGRIVRVVQDDGLIVFETSVEAVVVLVLRIVEEVVELPDIVLEVLILAVVVVLPVAVSLERAEAVEHLVLIGDPVRKGETEPVELTVEVFDSRILLVALGEAVCDREALLLLEYVADAVIVFEAGGDAETVFVIVPVFVDDDEPVLVLDVVDESDI